MNFFDGLARSLERNRVTRRQALWLLGAGAAGITFLKGISLEGMGNRQAAAQHYVAYLRQSQQSNGAQYSYDRLKAWGVVK